MIRFVIRFVGGVLNYIFNNRFRVAGPGGRGERVEVVYRGLPPYNRLHNLEFRSADCTVRPECTVINFRPSGHCCCLHVAAFWYQNPVSVLVVAFNVSHKSPDSGLQREPPRS